MCVDSDDDAHADIAFRVTFTETDSNGDQRATVRYDTGARADEPGAAGRILLDDALVSLGSNAQVTHIELDGGGRLDFFAGLRSDPFFADLAGAADFNFTGTDFFADSDVFAIAL